MADNHKNKEEIHRVLWRALNELRNQIEGWVFKDYVLTIMFYRFISEKIVDEIDSKNKSSNHESYKDMENKIVEENPRFKKWSLDHLGYFIEPNDLFCNVYKLAKNNYEGLCLKLTNIFKKIELETLRTENKKFEGLLSRDFFSTNLGKTEKVRDERLFKILNVINDLKLDFNNHKDGDIDTFGDAYEFLISMYAQNAGKSGGEYYTPQCVSNLLIRLAMLHKEKVYSIYDPACGSGSLLLQSTKYINDTSNIHFYGQDINPMTSNLAKMNMFLHGINYANFDIEGGEDTLTNPSFTNKKFDIILSNPPYSVKWEGDSNESLVERFNVAGKLPPKQYADLAFVLHSLSLLKDDGVAVFVCFPGIFYRNGAEQTIREYLVRNNFIDTIIALPVNLFYGTSIQVYVTIFRKNKVDKNILFVNASNFFKKETNQNILTLDNVNHIVELVKNRINVEYESKVVNNSDLDYEKLDLTVAKYCPLKEEENNIDINKLEEEIRETVLKQDKLRKEIDELVLKIGEQYGK